MIKSIVISDLHLGASNSILTDASLGGAPGCSSRPLELLASCLRDLAGDAAPQLIINGDLLEMALTTMNRATLVFDGFVEQLVAGGAWPFGADVVFLAGNHDHHLWEGAREVWYRHRLRTLGSLTELPDTPHVTALDGSIAGDNVNEPYIAGVFSRRKATSALRVTSAYPNFALRKDGRAVVLHHGHYVEPIYSLISETRGLMFPGTEPPADVAELEAENFAWIDFFWSTLGRSGRAGEDIFLIYDKLHDLNAMKSLMRGFATGILHSHRAHEWSMRIETAALQGLLDATLGRVAKLELHQAGVPLSASAAAGLQRYVEGPLHNQLQTEWKDGAGDITLVMGHTHKPFESTASFNGFNKPIDVYNTGGYVVDTPTPEHCHGGSIVVIDDALNVASIRLYTEPDTDADGALRVVSLQKDCTLVAELEERIQRADGPWQEFQREAVAAARCCRDRMRSRIAETPQISAV